MQRDTRQRRAIRRVFMNVGRPLTPDEVLEYGQQMVPSLGLATVYRNVKTLVDEVETLAPDGFEVDSHELILFGRCAACV